MLLLFRECMCVLCCVLRGPIRIWTWNNKIYPPPVPIAGDWPTLARSPDGKPRKISRSSSVNCPICSSSSSLASIMLRSETEFSIRAAKREKSNPSSNYVWFEQCERFFTFEQIVIFDTLVDNATQVLSRVHHTFTADCFFDYGFYLKLLYSRFKTLKGTIFDEL